MKNLRELVTIVNLVKIRDVSIVGKGRNWSGKRIKELYEGIAKGKFETDKQAAIYLYGKDYSKTAYTSLKKHLTDRLINTLFFIKLSDSPISDFQKIYFDIYKQNSVIKILAGKGAKVSSITLAERLISKSLKYQFTEVSLDLAKYLRRHYRIHEYDKDKAIKYDLIVKEQLAIFIAETEIEDYYEQLIFALKNKRNTPNYLAEKGKELSEKVRLIFPKCDSNKLGQFAHLIFVLEHELSKDFHQVESTCKKAIQYYQSKEEVGSIQKELVFHIKLLGAYIPLQKFEEGETTANSILEKIEIGSLNWFITLDLYFLLSMHTANYDKAKELFELAAGNKAFKKLAQQYREIWFIYESYIEFLKISKLIKSESNKKFRIARFLNQVPVFSKDKKGINISVLVIQILLLIAQGRETKVFDRVEALRTYVYTHLRNDESLRSNCFIKMLLKMAESNFHKDGTIRRTEVLRKKLLESPIGTKGYSQYVEIIPYEKLWEISLMYLSNRAY